MSDKVVIKGSMNLRNAISGTPKNVIPVGTNNYEALTNKPSINSVTLEGNKTAEDLGLASEAALEVERARIETLSDDIRLGIDGHIYASAGEAVRQQIRQATEGHRYGVSGIGQSASALTRLYDAVGMTAQVGTDGDNSNVVNGFDNVAPFNRKKCVGEWVLYEGKPEFRVHAYYGDDDYAEDGTKGDYVAVECPVAYYSFNGSTLVISDKRIGGFRPFDIFCRNHNVQDVMDVVYLPAYALALDENGHAVSLPDLDNEQGSYYSMVTEARTYKNGALGNYAMIQPMAVNFYEWALFTVEFAVQNCQSIMYGCGSLRHNADDRVTFIDSTHVLTNNYQAARVAGEYIAVIGASVDINDSTKQATHKIVSVTRCDANGTADASGTHQLLEVTDLGKNYYEYDLTGATEYRIAARSYRTGSCNTVSTPSGSPVSNSNGYYPMKYRWRENVFGNQYKTVMDLFNKRVVTGNDDDSLEWYYLADPHEYVPSDASKPDSTDLASEAFTLLDVTTEHANYVNGYIKSKKYSEEYPDVWIPHVITGGSGSTYFADYALLVLSNAVRACRLGGYWSAGASDGFSFLSGNIAPSLALAAYGGDLFIQQG